MGCMELSSRPCAEIGVPIVFSRVSQGMSGVSQRKPSQLSCMMGTGHCSEANAGELVMISSLFGLHQAISHSCGDISVLLDF